MALTPAIVMMSAVPRALATGTAFAPVVSVLVLPLSASATGLGFAPAIPELGSLTIAVPVTTIAGQATAPIWRADWSAPAAIGTAAARPLLLLAHYAAPTATAFGRGLLLPTVGAGSLRFTPYADWVLVFDAVAACVLVLNPDARTALVSTIDAVPVLDGDPEAAFALDFVGDAT
jgi:hypothetical protein